MKSTKQINIKDCTYYFCNDIIDIKTFDSNMLKVDKKAYKNDTLQLKILVLVVVIVLIA